MPLVRSPYACGAPAALFSSGLAQCGRSGSELLGIDAREHLAVEGSERVAGRERQLDVDLIGRHVPPVVLLDEHATRRHLRETDAQRLRALASQLEGAREVSDAQRVQRLLGLEPVDHAGVIASEEVDHDEPLAHRTHPPEQLAVASAAMLDPAVRHVDHPVRSRPRIPRRDS